MCYYKYEVSDELDITVTWYDPDDNIIISGTKKIGPKSNPAVIARSFAEDLKDNNQELFPEEEYIENTNEVSETTEE